MSEPEIDIADAFLAASRPDLKTATDLFDAGRLIGVAVTFEGDHLIAHTAPLVTSVPMPRRVHSAVGVALCKALNDGERRGWTPEHPQ